MIHAVESVLHALNAAKAPRDLCYPGVQRHLQAEICGVFFLVLIQQVTIMHDLRPGKALLGK